MTADWFDFLARQGARTDGTSPAGVVDFGDAGAERLAARDDAVLCDLSHRSVLGFTGDDAQTFLQGQLTCDVREATRTASRPGALCTPKGRALATFRLWQDEAGFCMLLPQPLAEPVRRRLAMYVLRAKVKVADASADTVRLGLAGPRARARLAEALGADIAAVAPGGDAVRGHDGLQVLGLPGERVLVIVPPAVAPALWTRLASRCRPAGSAAWRWAAIAAREPDVLPATQEQFVPQMLNLDLVGGIGFQKGCYTGQEIVARTQYLGRLKQRLYHAHLALDSGAGGPVLPQPGDPLYSDDFDGQSTGMVVDAAPAPGGGVDLLAVIRTDSAASRPIRWARSDGPALAALSLPQAAAAAGG